MQELLEIQSKEWKSILDYPDYKISNFGDVLSFKKKHGLNGKMMADRISGNGYLMVTLWNKRGKLSFHIHRLVLEHFGPPQPSLKHECCHNDGDRINNHISNLRWGTRKENFADKNIHGTSPRGENNGHAKLTKNEVSRIKKLYRQRFGPTAIAGVYGVSPQLVCDIGKGRRWSHVKEEK